MLNSKKRALTSICHTYCNTQVDRLWFCSVITSHIKGYWKDYKRLHTNSIPFHWLHLLHLQFPIFEQVSSVWFTFYTTVNTQLPALLSLNRVRYWCPTYSLKIWCPNWPWLRQGERASTLRGRASRLSPGARDMKLETSLSRSVQFLWPPILKGFLLRCVNSFVIYK